MATKKSFSGNAPAAAAFITTPAEKPKTPGTVAAPDGYRVDYGIVETKSRRVKLLMQPSLHTRLKEAAAEQGVSFNDYVHKALERALEQE